MNDLQLYLGEKQEKLVNLTLVSKQVYDDCKRPGAIEWKIIPTMIEPNSDQQRVVGGSILTRITAAIVSPSLLDNDTNKKLRRCLSLHESERCTNI